MGTAYYGFVALSGDDHDDAICVEIYRTLKGHGKSYFGKMEICGDDIMVHLFGNAAEDLPPHDVTALMALLDRASKHLRGMYAGDATHS